MRRTIVLLTTIAMTLLVATSVAMAENFNFVNCPSSGLCTGTNDADSISGGSGDNSILGYDGDDLITSGPGGTYDNTTGKDSVYGGNGNDYMWGGAGNDTMFGDDGDDVITGGIMEEKGADYDSMYGGWGKDGLGGGRYNDFYYGGQNSDRMLDYSKVSNDTYDGLFPIWWGYGDVGGIDLVRDYGGTGDILDLHYFDRSQVFITWADSADAGGSRDSLRVQQKGTTNYVYLSGYFDNLGAFGRGVGAIEIIKFKDVTYTQFPIPQG